ncbi:MAG TPA: hypothetical protein VH255_00355 [Verrucomicrobiae bacterium]|nr:hypothetical protein [Verrucomicrobiae bacterium]
MKTVAGFFAALALMALPTIVDALNSPATPADFDVTPTNYPAAGFTPTNLPLTTSLVNTGSTNVNQVLPVIEMRDVPISGAIENLARQAGINYLVAPQLEQKWSEAEQPLVSFKLHNVTAKDVLKQMLELRHIALVEDPVSNIAFIIPADEIGNPLFTGLTTNLTSLHTNLIPLIQFSDVPITTAIENLALQEDVNYILTPKVSRQWDGSSPAGLVPEPQLSLRLEHVTAWGVLNRMLNIRDLMLVEDTTTRVARVAFRGQILPSVDISVLDTGTNGLDPNTDHVIPMIQFAAVPIDMALENLIQQCGLHIELDPLLKDYSDPQNQPPQISLRWSDLTAKQALVALCENYDLIVTKSDSTGIIQIMPGKVKRRTSP